MGRLNLALADRLRSRALAWRWRLAPRGRLVATLPGVAILEVGDAARSAGTLFQRIFSATIPDFPRHFILVPADAPAAPALAYVHYTQCGDGWLAGGLVADSMRLRRLDRGTLEAVRREGGFSEWLMRATCAALHGAAVFALIGDRRSEAVNVRVGFEKTAHPHLFVLWKGAPSPRERERLIARVVAVGTF
jgi:hypothetical protein